MSYNHERRMSNAEWEEWREYERAFLATQPYRNVPLVSLPENWPRILLAIVAVGLLLEWGFGIG